MTIKLKRVYDKPVKADGYRILIDRLWPRGVSHDEAALDEWAKEIAPSAGLRTWFDHIPDHWWRFQKKYIAELQHNAAMRDFVERHRHKKTITLVYSTRYDHLTHAIILKQYLENVWQDARIKN